MNGVAILALGGLPVVTGSVQCLAPWPRGGKPTSRLAGGLPQLLRAERGVNSKGRIAAALQAAGFGFS